MINNELIQRITGRHEHRHRSSATAAGPSYPLPRRRDRSWITRQNRHIEAADIDTKLECVGGYHATNCSVTKAAFNLPAFVREVTTAVSNNHVVRDGTLREGVLQVSH